MGSNQCIDSPGKREDLHKPVGLYPCHNQGGNQYWMLSKLGEIRRDEACLDYGGTEVIIYPCHGEKGNQLWKYDADNDWLVHSSEKCLTISEDRAKLSMEECDPERPDQNWVIKDYDPSKLLDEPKL